jgi:NAD(P)-dependent dehydrogenase (short-subunit alcohol dehydrogenase family)
MRLQGKLAVVTGGSEGIGLAICEALAREGAEVVIVGRTMAKLSAAQLQIGKAAIALVPTDLSTESGIGAVVEQVRQLGRPLDILVSNAAVAHLAAFESITAEQYNYSVALNVSAPFFLTQRLLPHFTQPGASIINISSYFAGKMIMNRPLSVYSLSKGAINSLTKSLAFELGPRGIRVNAVSPGTVNTPMRKRSVDAMSKEHQEELQKYVERSYPLGTIGKPSDLGGIAVFLASDEASWVTGSIFAIDGGFTAG